MGQGGEVTSPDPWKEGFGAFFEKRNPEFKATLEEDAPPIFPWWSEVDAGNRPRAEKPKL